MNEDEFNKFYDAYKQYAQDNKEEKISNIYDFESFKEPQKKIRQDDGGGFDFKLVFGIKASDSFIDKMDGGLDRIQKALDDLRNELYLYPEF
jgi:hypothetical protein